MSLEWLPQYTPELNDIERCWRDLKQHYLSNRTVTDLDALERVIHSFPPAWAAFCEPGFPRWIGPAGPKAAETLAKLLVPSFTRRVLQNSAT